MTARPPRLVVIDYGAGNLRSAAKALERFGARVSVADRPAALRRADGIVLPGDGAFGQSAANLKARGWFGPLRAWVRERRPFLGICLGLQLLFDESREFGLHRGLGCFPGKVVRFPRKVRTPHMGWNVLEPAKRSWILAGLPRAPYAYFVHSYYPVPADAALVAATTRHGVRFASVIEDGPVAAMQFHPEKSQATGLRMLRNFLAAVRRWR